MAVGHRHGGIGNQEGMTTPFTSPWGEALRAATPQLINHPAPLTKGDRKRKGYGGIIGGMSTLSASVVAISSEQGYGGDLPQSQQTVVAALPPWERDF